MNSSFVMPQNILPLHYYLNSHFPCLTSWAAAAKSSKKQYPTHFHRSTSSCLLIKCEASQSLIPHLPSKMVTKLPLVPMREGQMAISVYGGKNECLKMSKFPNNIGAAWKKMSEANFSPAETLHAENFKDWTYS